MPLPATAHLCGIIPKENRRRTSHQDLGLGIKNWIANRLPDALRGRIDYYRHPELADYWGGPFNGQSSRQQACLSLLRACNFEFIVETGSFRGSTTLFLAQNGNAASVYSCESDGRVFHFAKCRLRGVPKTFLFHADSPKFLRDLKFARQAQIFFYLDAHWGEDLPLQKELALILERFENFVIMIDDFEVPGDPGYGFDDYGTGKQLSLRDFPLHRDKRITCYLPCVPSSQETGLKRGAIVAASHNLTALIDGIAALRRLDRSDE